MAQWYHSRHKSERFPVRILLMATRDDSGDGKHKQEKSIGDQESKLPLKPVQVRNRGYRLTLRNSHFTKLMYVQTSSYGKNILTQTTFGRTWV